MKRKFRTHYSLMDELMASNTQPMSEKTRQHQIQRMAHALHEMMHAERPSNEAWRVLADAVNLLETLVQCGETPRTIAKDGKDQIIASCWRDCDGDPVEIADTSGLLSDAVDAMVSTGEQMSNGHLMRLTGPSITAVRAVLDDYTAALTLLPARTMVRCHRKTEKRMHEVISRIGSLPYGVHVVSL